MSDDADRDVFLPVGAQPSIDALCEQAERAEELGYDRVWLPETWGRDAVTVLTSIAHRTDEIGIGTSIVPIYSRSPALLGQTAATLQEVSDGRFRLGLGPSGPIVVESWHGVDYGNPLRRTRETVEIVQRVFTGEEIDYDGDYFDLSGFRLRCEPPEPAPAVDAAGMGPKSVELAGRFADGWHALMLTREGIRERLDDLRRGAALADRDPDDVRVTLSLTCAALDDGKRARESVRQHLAFYVGGMGTFYRDSLARIGHEDTAEAIYEHWQAGDREAAMAAVDDELLDSIAVAGTPQEARERFGRFAAIDGVDHVSVSFPRDATLDEIEATTAALAP
ncbi:TIGR04024 family LLM class F420-dependent oxidoreductase [Halococcus dombrowskii]|uniref:TIGR04024 family LLM class F420-dependent oxidoreductase n=1 Tax=Halococcus dombrowskii TaxID=179637 RepID=A0AAV3SLP1_HALDO|nr:TIGR04024 family LLM class F420-dependent oxidoreductase [Halococcus dombrowskii]UOO94083.1 TIGR04024 family LLM class F420-dependent oxidoreductase [Halococcus dombrowskii]